MGASRAEISNVAECVIDIDKQYPADVIDPSLTDRHDRLTLTFITQAVNYTSSISVITVSKPWTNR
jgi:hypothetical protein